MKINTNALITNVSLKNGKSGPYLLINLLDRDSGEIFTIIEKNVELMQSLEKFAFYDLELNLTPSRYGLHLNIVNIVKKTNNI